MKLTEKEFNDLYKKLVADKEEILPDPAILGSVIDEPIDPGYVSVHNDELTEKYDKLLSAYGYDDFEGMYLASGAVFAKYDNKVSFRNKEAEKATSKNKDTSKLRLVQRTVMRRGKPTTLSFYEDPNKGAKTTASGENQSKDSTDENQEGADFSGFYTSGLKFGKPDKERIASHMPPDNWYTVGSMTGRMYDCLYFVNGTTFDVVAGVKKKGNLLTLAFVSTPDKESYQAGLYRSLKKLVYLIYDLEASGQSIGFTYAPRKNEEDICKVLFDYFDIKKHNGAYTQANLENSLGKREWIKW